MRRRLGHSGRKGSGRPLSGRHADRQSWRHHAARARSAGGLRRHRLRRYARQPQAHRALRHRYAADALSRTQCRRGAAEDSGAACARRGGRAGVRRRHAADFRSRLQAGARGARRRLRDNRDPRRVIGADRAECRRIADRSLFLRRFFAGQASGAAEAHRGAGKHSGDIGAVRKRAAACGNARRSGRRLRPARRRDLPRAHQAARGSPPRRSADARARLCARRRDARRDRHRGGAAGREPKRKAPTSTTCCGWRWRAYR